MSRRGKETRRQQGRPTLKVLAGVTRVAGPGGALRHPAQKTRRAPALALVALAAVLAAVSWGPGARAEGTGAAGGSFLRDEFLVRGTEASGAWRNLEAVSALAFDQIGGGGLGDEFGSGAASPKDEDQEQGPSDLGTKVKAGLLSAVLPGAGQFYNGQKSKAYVMVGVEAAIWTTYFVFDAQGDARMKSSREWAGIYAGTSGTHGNSYWQNVGHYADSDAYNESRLREARALRETVSGLVSDADAWQWVNRDRQIGYAKLRADGNSAYDRRDFMILFAVVNRAVSVVDAVLNAGGGDTMLATEVLGMNMELELSPSFHDPGARWVVSRSF